MKGASELDENGRFKVSLPQEIVESGVLKQECYAQLHSASSAPCPSHGGLDYSKIVSKSISDDKHTLGPAAGKLSFSSSLCPSAFFWPFLKHPHFPFPPKDKGYPSPVPLYKDPQPPPVPVYKKPPSSPVKKPPTSSPIVKKPCPPKDKTPSTPTPTYKPPSTPIYKPLPPPTPISEPPPTTMPPFFNFFPPFPKFHPFKKKPCPPLPKMDPPNYFYQHPWFGGWPPLSPSHS